MLTVTNNLTTHLVIPRGMATGKALMLLPKGTVQVGVCTESIKDAERNGLVTLGRVKPEQPPVAQEPEETAAAAVPEVCREPEEKEERQRQILALVGAGKTQKETAQALGITRNMVQKALDKHRKSNDLGKE